MTQWLDISTYPYDGSWGIFRGGRMNRLPMPLMPTVIGFGFNQHGEEGRIAVALDTYYLKPTEWLPLSILDTIEDYQITAARIVL